MPVINRSIRFDLAPSLRVTRIGWADLPPGSWEMRGAINPAWTYYRNDVDGAELILPGGRFPLPAGRLVLIPGGFRFDSTCRAQVRHLYGYFELVGISRYRVRAIDQPVLTDEADADGFLAGLAAERSGVPSVPSLLALNAVLTRAFLKLLPPDLTHASPEATGLEPALALIEDGYARPLANRDLAAACNVSVNTFLRRFKTLTGTTPTQALRARRVQAAARLLADGDETLDEVARRCGLATRPYLGRVFQAVLGVSPGSFRRANRVA